MRQRAYFFVHIAALLGCATDTAWAQISDFQLPRECLERQVENPERCVIQNGREQVPWVHRVPLNNPQQQQPGPGTGGGTVTPPPAPPGAFVPRRR